MAVNSLQKSLEDYARVSPLFFDQYVDLELVERKLSFLLDHPDAFHDAYFPGHFTGSALIVSADHQRVLLTHHRKLNLWLQLGGHADHDKDLSKVALREAREESGLEKFLFYHFPNERGIIPFDIDIHAIPERGFTPGHLHYDVRYLLICEDDESHIQISEESHDLRWFTWSEAAQKTSELSMQRQFYKARKILSTTKLT